MNEISNRRRGEEFKGRKRTDGWVGGWVGGWKETYVWVPAGAHDGVGYACQSSKERHLGGECDECGRDVDVRVFGEVEVEAVGNGWIGGWVRRRWLIGLDGGEESLFA